MLGVDEAHPRDTSVRRAAGRSNCTLAEPSHSLTGRKLPRAVASSSSERVEAGQLRRPPPAAASHLFDIAEAYGVVLESLSHQSLASVACCCRQLRGLVEGSAWGAERWRRLAEAELGRGSAALHARYLANPGKQDPHGTHPAAASRSCDSRTGGDSSAKAPRDAAVAAKFWRNMLRSVRSGGELHWGKSPATRLWSQIRTHSSDGSDAQVPNTHNKPAPAEHSSLSQLLARSGHTATMLDEQGLLVIVGGLFNECDSTPEASVLVIRLPSLEILAPVVTGPQGSPPSRYRHAAVLLPASMQTACLEYFRGGELEAGGAVLAIYGGYDSGAVYGGSELLLLWISPDGSKVRWGCVTTSGTPPPPCFHHTLVGLRRVPSLVLVGGECSHEPADQAAALGTPTMPPNAVFTLWLPTMVWEVKHTRREPSCIGDPCQRWLHACALRPEDDVSAEAGEELVVVGGITPEGIDEMVPYVLQLATYTWRRPPYSLVFQHDCPPGRHRFASATVGRSLIVNGGCDLSRWLDDTAILDLGRLSWRPAPKMNSAPLGHQAVAGHTLAGLIAFGGCERGFFGVSPVAKMDVLMFGEPRKDDAKELGSSAQGSPSQQATINLDNDGTAAIMQVVAGPNDGGHYGEAGGQTTSLPAPVASMYDTLFHSFAAAAENYALIGNESNTSSSGEGSFDASEWVGGDSDDVSDTGHGGEGKSGSGDGPSRGGSGSGSGGNGSGEAANTVLQDSGSCDELPNASDSSEQNQGGTV